MNGGALGRVSFIEREPLAIEGLVKSNLGLKVLNEAD
jgi:hypothetical protein